ncbi:MAG TPA: adenylate/guanylate cyclase domain-containing protein [Methylomirabilota bacterium]|nr:adenylate/guanylate cyclase domain-containing protein [Methylomirabilota bacterium]
MKCPRCRHENEAGAKFCEECAAPLARACTKCGRQLSPTAKFCPECAHPTGLPTTPLPAQRFGSPEAYTPKHLAERILASKSSVEGERKLVTVLFCDIVESTALAARLGAEAMHELLDRALRLMAEAVHRYEGTVNQFLGDGLMALFGAPVALEDHALRAVEAALAIQETIGGLSEELRRTQEVEMRLRLGLNTGLVVVGRIGDDLRMDYTAVGETTNLAARMQARAEPGSILVTEATHRIVVGHVRSEAGGRVDVKGLTEPVVTHRIVGRRRRTRLEVSAERGLSALVGRERELAVLRERFDRAREGRGQAVGIVGEPGVGKSRLLYEFHRTLVGERVTFLAGHCLAYGRSTPYLPLLEILRANFQVEEGDNPLQTDEKLRRGLRALDRGLEGILPHLRELLLHGPEEALKALDAKAKRQQTFEAIRTLTVAGSERAPIVLVVEDLHWIDHTSEAYLKFLVESLGGLRVLLVTTHRPGHAVGWADKTYYTQLPLDLLDPVGTETLMGGLLGVRQLPDGLVRLVHEKAEGNPLFVEEITHAMLERGALVQERGGLRWAGAVAVEFPETAQDIIRARIDRLDEPVKRTAQVAAVIGREFGQRLLSEVVETASVVQECLDTLKHAELVQEKRFFPETEWLFKHAIIQDVAYQSILARRRRELHAAIGRAIEALHADQLVEHFETLAHHFSEGGVPDKAVEYLVKAGDKAAAAFANQEARALYERALALVGADDPATRATVLRPLVPLIIFCFQDFDVALRYAHEALDLYEGLGDKPRMIEMHSNLQLLYMSGAWDGAREDQALRHLEVLARLTEGDPDSPQKGLFYQRQAHLHVHRGRPATAAAWAQRAVDLFARLGVPMGTCLGTVLTYTGQIDRGLEYSVGNWDAVLRSANPIVQSVFGHELVLTLALLRDPARAREWGERVLPEVLKANSLFQEANLRRPLTLAGTLAGEPEAARDADAVERIERETLTGCPWEDTAGVALHLLRTGAPEAARAHLVDRLTVWERRNQVAAISGCSLVLAACQLDLDDPAAAEPLALRSLDICRQGGNVLFELWVLPVLCDIYLGTGRPEQALECVERGFVLLASAQD